MVQTIGSPYKCFSWSFFHRINEIVFFCELIGWRMDIKIEIARNDYLVCMADLAKYLSELYFSRCFIDTLTCSISGEKMSVYHEDGFVLHFDFGYLVAFAIELIEHCPGT